VQTQPNISFPEILPPREVTSVSPAVHPSTAQTSISVYGRYAGLSDYSGGFRLGATSCVSTRWLNDTLVTCRTADGAGIGFTTTSSVLLNHGSLSNVFSYSRVAFNVTSIITAALAMSGAELITISGSHFGSFSCSQSSKFGDTASESSIWKSSSSVLSKSTCCFSRIASVMYVLTFARQLSSTQSFPLVWFQNVSVADWRTYSNTHSSDAATALITGRHGGQSLVSARINFAGSACESTQWLSDSIIQLRIS
jgi:hypothetical protein